MSKQTEFDILSGAKALRDSQKPLQLWSQGGLSRYLSFRKTLESQRENVSGAIDIALMLSSAL